MFFRVNGKRVTWKKYHPMSLVPICEKILEKLMFNEMFQFFLKINSFLQVSLVLNWVIPAPVNYNLLLMRYIVLLIKVLVTDVLLGYRRFKGIIVSLPNQLKIAYQEITKPFA